jgi:predicted enzyme related to lactoylglutathione lyase
MCPELASSFVVSLNRTKNLSKQTIMSTQTKTKLVSQKSNAIPAKIVWFEIPADNVERARTFYNKLFGWKIEKFPGAAAKPYWLINTGSDDPSRNGGMLERQHPGHSITNYIGVASVDEAAARVEKLGGTICMEKTVVPEMGYFVICTDTENNTFALWEPNESAK